MGKVETMVETEAGIELGQGGGTGQQREDAAAIVVQQHDHHRMARVAQQCQAVQIVQGRGVTEEQGGDLAARLSTGDAGGGGDQAIDAGGAAIAEQRAGLRCIGACGCQHLPQSGGQTVAQQQGSLPQGGEAMGDGQFAPAIDKGEQPGRQCGGQRR